MNMHKHYYILLLTYIIAIGICNALQRDRIALYQHSGYYHPGPVYKSVTIPDHTDLKSLWCMKQCVLDLACVSINFNRTSDECSLLGEIWEDGELMPHTNTDFFGKSYF